MNEGQFAAFSAKTKLKGSGISLSSKKTISTQNKAALKAVSLKLSSHARALDKLRKKPELIKGKREHFLQVAVFDHIDREYPELYDLMYSIPNGGHRGIKAATEMKAEGQKSGYPDIGVDAARGVYHGFRLELKTDDGNKQEHQETYAKKLRAQGYCVVLCYGFDSAIEAILEYWNLPPKGQLSREQYKQQNRTRSKSTTTK
ncbi:hypothetical protein [Aliivibrio salmonicida]|uniref:hypothetical protein n=1 Tax=Aliivibrio salmonicida TaxID=40269 RepID=UPI003D142426